MVFFLCADIIICDLSLFLAILKASYIADTQLSYIKNISPLLALYELVTHKQVTH